MLSLLAKTMCRRNQLTMPRADPEEVAGVRTPAPWKITKSVGLYKSMQLDPLHLGKVEPSELFLVSRAWTPPPSTAKPDEKFLDPRVDIRYRGGIETISLLKTFYSAAKI